LQEEGAASPRRHEERAGGALALVAARTAQNSLSFLVRQGQLHGHSHRAFRRGQPRILLLEDRARLHIEKDEVRRLLRVPSQESAAIDAWPCGPLEVLLVVFGIGMELEIVVPSLDRDGLQAAISFGGAALLLGREVLGPAAPAERQLEHERTTRAALAALEPERAEKPALRIEEGPLPLRAGGIDACPETVLRAMEEVPPHWQERLLLLYRPAREIEEAESEPPSLHSSAFPERLRHLGKKLRSFGEALADTPRDQTRGQPVETRLRRGL